MARTSLTIRLQSIGREIAQRSIASIGEVMAYAEGDEVGFDVRFRQGRAYVDGAECAILQSLPIQGDLIVIQFRPGIGMPLLVAKVLALVPGSSVIWQEGWPIMSPPSPRDPDDEYIPVPTGGELVKAL
jgi:hypothetical protein